MSIKKIIISIISILYLSVCMNINIYASTEINYVKVTEDINSLIKIINEYKENNNINENVDDILFEFLIEDSKSLNKDNYNDYNDFNLYIMNNKDNYKYLKNDFIMITPIQNINFKTFIYSLYYSKNINKYKNNIYDLYSFLLNQDIINSIDNNEIFALIDSINISNIDDSFIIAFNDYYNNISLFKQSDVFFQYNFLFDDSDFLSLFEENFTNINKIEKNKEDYIKIKEQIIELKNKQIKDINITNIPKQIILNENIDLNIDITPKNTINNNYIITSSDDSIASIKDNKLYSNNIGNCIISITINNLKKDYKIEVIDKIKSLTLKEKNIQLEIGDEKNIEYSFNTKIKADVFYKNFDSKIISIDESGKIKALNEGMTTIECHLKSDPSIYDETKIVVNKGIEKIKILNDFDFLYLNQSTEIQVKIIPTYKITSNKYKFISSDDSIATIDENGIIKTLNVGKVTITCISNKNPKIYDEKTFFVYKKIDTLNFDKNKLNIYLNNNTLNDSFSLKYCVNNDSFYIKNNDIYNFNSIKFVFSQNDSILPSKDISYDGENITINKPSLNGDIKLLAYIDSNLLSFCDISIFNNTYNYKNIDSFKKTDYIYMALIHYKNILYTFIIKFILITFIIFIISSIIFFYTKYKINNK